MRDDLLHVDRLREKIVSAGFDSAKLRLDALFGEEDERDRRSLCPRLELAAKLEAVDTALEASFGDDQIGRRLADGLQSLGRRRGGPDVEARVAQAELEESPDLRVTVDDEYSASPRMLIRSRFH